MSDKEQTPKEALAIMLKALCVASAESRLTVSQLENANDLMWADHADNFIEQLARSGIQLVRVQ